MAATKLGYRPELDGLRGVAVLTVLAGHAMLERFPSLAGYAVEIFFVLSGFLITSLLVEEREGSGTVRLGAFYLRRARRLLPALALLLAAVAAVAVVAGNSRALNGVIGGVTYSSNWLQIGGWDITPLRHLWSLAVEEHFYLLWPVVVIGVGTSRGVLRVAVAGAAGSLLWRWVLVAEGAGHVRVNDGTDTRMSALLIGAALAAGFRLGWRADTRKIGAAITAAVVLVAPGPHLWGYLACSVGVALLILGAVTTGAGWLRCQPLVWFGGISYALYLWHVPIMRWAGFRLPLVTVAASVLVAWLSTRYWESRFRSRPNLSDGHQHRDAGRCALNPGLDVGGFNRRVLQLERAGCR